MIFKKNLFPGKCECGHSRCCHKKGKGKCNVATDPEEGYDCACLIYIPVGMVEKENDKEIDQLRKLAGL